MTGWTNGSVADPHQVGERGSIPLPVKDGFKKRKMDWITILKNAGVITFLIMVLKFVMIYERSLRNYKIETKKLNNKLKKLSK